jgi:hypothetical protein
MKPTCKGPMSKGSLPLKHFSVGVVQILDAHATQASLERERSTVAAFDHGLHNYPALGGTDHFEPKASLRTEQRHDIETRRYERGEESLSV